ncbi:two-component regulator propeller domain-containing protein [Catalinimonas sp. 4WD22]|uniref:ligand-binding sensor domain-containing protein n=1 Tax=Catalinimonas locisalis TaxID=3133978 RepID=UPI003100ECCD
MTRKLLNLTLFFSLAVELTSCDGQIKKDLPKEMVSESKVISVGQPKLIKTQGSQKGDNVNTSLQDKAGNLWFGTTGEGLYQYDGKSFIQYTTTNGLNSNTIHCILEDKDGKIWIGTAAGICLYDGDKFNHIQIPLPPDLPPNKYHATHNVFDIMQDNSGKLWFATIDGVYVYDGKSFTPFIINEDGGGFMSSNHNVERILEDKAGNIWFGGRVNSGVFRYDGKSITNLKLNGDDWAWPALVDKKGDIWFSNWDGAYVYDGKSFTRINGLPYGPTTQIVEDKKGNLWFGGGGRGICRYDGKTFTCLTAKDGLLNEGVWSILEDKSGNLWVGTRNTGLFRYDGEAFTSFTDINFSDQSVFFPNVK